MEDSQTYNILWQTYQPYITGTKRTIPVTWNNLISKYFNSNFGNYPERLLLVYQDHFEEFEFNCKIYDDVISKKVYGGM